MVVAVLLAAFLSPASALVQQMSLSDLVQQSDTIIKGNVVSMQSKEVTDQRGTHIYTMVTLAVSSKVKGTLAGQTLTIELPGGTVGDLTEAVSDTPMIGKGEEAVLFLKNGALVGGFQGKLSVFDGKVYVDNQEVGIDNLLRSIDKTVQSPGSKVSLVAEPLLTVGDAGTIPAAEVTAVTKTVEPPAAKEGGAAVVVTEAGQVTASQAPIENKPEPKVSGPAIAVVGGGETSDPGPVKKSPAPAQADGPALVVTGQGQVPAGQAPTDPKPAPTGPQPTILTATIYNAWWTNQVDNDADGYRRTATLNWDPDVAGGSGSLQVYERIYYKAYNTTTYVLLYTMPVHTITGVLTSDSRYLGLIGNIRNLYDFRIDIYRVGINTADYIRSETNDADLNNYGMEPASMDAPTATIYNAWWTNQVDNDADGYKRSARLNWDPDVAGVGSLAVYEKVYYKAYTSTAYILLYTKPVHTITGVLTTDGQFLDLIGNIRNAYDFKIEIYRSGVSTPDYARSDANDTDLNDYRMEPASLDVPLATIYNAWWTNQVDNDSDGYKRSATLNWDPDVVGLGSLVVYEKVWYKAYTSTAYTLLYTMPAHTITGLATTDARYLNLIGNIRNLYDFKIDVYRSGVATLDYSRNEVNDADLNNYGMEPASQDPLLTATIYNAWWTNQVDADGDGYKRSATLNWDPDVVGGTGPLSVFEKLYYKVSTVSTWTFVYQTPVHSITGLSTADARYVNISTSGRAMFDFKIEVWRSGKAAPDYTRSDANDADLNDYKLEPAAQDGGTVTPVITTISPNKASAGTNTQVVITGVNFGATQGTSKVEFFYRSGQPKIPAAIVSWSNTQIRCTVPIGTVSGYPGSAGSGPVTVTTGGGTSAGYTFRVTFGYGQIKWSGATPVVGYRINENTADCTGEGLAIRNAAGSWNAVGSKLSFSYLGTHTGTTASRDYSNRIMWAFVSTPGVIATAYYWSSGGIMSEADIVFNDNFTWSTAATVPAGAMDVQTISVHELGHWLSLRDLYGNVGDGVYDNGKVMYGFGANGLNKRILHTDDRSGISYIYP